MGLLILTFYLWQFTPFFFPIRLYKIKKETTTPQCCAPPLMTDFIVVHQHSSPNVWNHYQVLSLPANPPVYTSRFAIGFKVSPHQQDVVRFPTYSILNNCFLSTGFEKFLCGNKKIRKIRCE